MKECKLVESGHPSVLSPVMLHHDKMPPLDKALNKRCVIVDDSA